jgi:uracil-DNA glycosylase family 4
MFIGEAPGREEDAQGRPFVGLVEKRILGYACPGSAQEL